MLDKYYEIKRLEKKYWTEGLKNIPQPPEKLHIRGYDQYIRLIEEGYRFVCIVGSRKNTEYSERVIRELLEGLQGQKVCIVSGLAYGVDTIAHRIAIDYGLPTITFPGSGLNTDVIYPRGHTDLATQILQNGGALISEFDNDERTKPYFFKQRNRLMAGMCDLVVIVEANLKSGSTMTANFAIEYDTELGCVPGSIFNPQSEACNHYISMGAKVVMESKDLL